MDKMTKFFNKMSKEDEIIMRLSNELLEIVDDRDEFSRGDLQAILEAFVMKNCKFN